MSQRPQEGCVNHQITTCDDEPRDRVRRVVLRDEADATGPDDAADFREQGASVAWRTWCNTFVAETASSFVSERKPLPTSNRS